jgi:hypothetical protein
LAGKKFGGRDKGLTSNPNLDKLYITNPIRRNKMAKQVKEEQAKLELMKEIDRLKAEQQVENADYQFVVSEMKRLESELDPRVIRAIKGGLNELAHSLSWYDNNIAAYYEEIDTINQRKVNTEAKQPAMVS